jgi:toxin ParE1/3/4
MATYRLSQAAARDLLELGRYTQARWGVGQRRNYVARLKLRLQMLADRPSRGVVRNDIAPGYRSFREARHVIIYTERPDGIDVARVLHERMDVARHLLVDRGDDDGSEG